MGDTVLVTPHIVGLGIVQEFVRFMSFISRAARDCVALAGLMVRARHLGVREVVGLRGDLAVRHGIGSKGMMSREKIGVLAFN